MNNPIGEIKQAVAENRTSDAISRLLEMSKNDKDLHNSILIFSGEFKELTSQHLKGTIDNNEATRRTAVVHDKILVALGAFDSAGRVLPGSVVVRKNTSSNSLLKATLFLFALTPVTYLITNYIWRVAGRGDGIDLTMLTFIPLIFGAITFVGFVIAIIVNASKK